MRSERGSATILAIVTMMVLAASSAAYAYVANRNVDIATEYANGLQAQYSAEAGVKTAYVAGMESIKEMNGWSAGQNSALADWLDKTVQITLPNGMGSCEVTVKNASGGNKGYYVQSVARLGKVSRMVYNNGIDPSNTITLVDITDGASTTSLIRSGVIWRNTSSYDWQLPASTDTTSPAKSPGSGTANGWSSISSQVLFNDVLGLSTFSAKAKLQLLFRVNYYIKLTNVPSNSSSGSGYGIYYLAKKISATEPGIPGDPTSYVLQYDPGLHPGYGSPPGGTSWGAAFSTGTSSNWPYGAFLVKKAWSDGAIGAQNEVWDEGGSYNDHCAFQDNNELTQRYYNISGSIRPSLSAASLVNVKNSSEWALQPAITSPGTKAPTITRVPTAFGYDNSGRFSTELTTKYRERPPDLRIAYTLGNIAEGNPWQKNTFYPLGAKVAVGVWVHDALNKRLIWEATTAGISGASKPSQMDLIPVIGTTVVDGGVTWTAKAAPSPESVANSILNYALNGSLFSIAKISMADLKFRVDSVNGSREQEEPYNIPFTMVQGNKNKITIELWADNQGNRVHVIRVNDVLILGFNDRAGKAYDVIPSRWELNPASNPRSTGIRIWNAAAEFYSADNYGQTMSYITTSNYGIWGK